MKPTFLVLAAAFALGRQGDYPITAPTHDFATLQAPDALVGKPACQPR